MTPRDPFQSLARLACAVCAAVIALGLPARAQAPQAAAPAPAPTTGPRTVSAGMLHVNVASLTQSLAFYRDVLGMEMFQAPTTPNANGNLTNVPGAMISTARVRAPGGSFQMEMVEWTGTPLRPQQLHIQDPGEIMLAFNVRDFDAKLAGAKKLGLQVVSKNGEPYVSQGRGGPNKAIMLRDPSGFIVELTDVNFNPATAASAPAGGITSVAIWFSVADLAQTVNFYNKAFGTSMAAPNPANPANDRIKGLFNDPSIATMRNTRATFPNTDLTVNFQEFTGPAKKAVHHRVVDPGGPIMTFNVEEFPAVMQQVVANGGMIGDGDASAPVPTAVAATWVRDPNGVLLRVSPPAQGRGRGGNAAQPQTAPSGRQ
jgi:predicted enzyme related to lactoylglutathione lyase